MYGVDKLVNWERADMGTIILNKCSIVKGENSPTLFKFAGLFIILYITTLTSRPWATMTFLGSLPSKYF